MQKSLNQHLCTQSIRRNNTPAGLGNIQNSNTALMAPNLYFQVSAYSILLKTQKSYNVKVQRAFIGKESYF